MMGIGCFQHSALKLSNGFLSRIDQLIDDEEVRDQCRRRFSCRGRPSYDPAAYLRIALLGQLLGLKSDRKTLELIRDNASYRSFVAAPLLPHPSTLSRMRKRLNESFFQVIFESTLVIAKQRGILDGEELYTDCTLIEACASDDQRPIHFKKTGNRTIRINRFDKDAGFVAKLGMRPGFFYKSMYTIDARARIITDCHVFNGKTFDSVHYLDRLRALPEEEV